MRVVSRSSISGFYISLALHVVAIFTLVYALDTKSKLPTPLEPMFISLKNFELPKEVSSKVAKPEPIKKEIVQKSKVAKVEKKVEVLEPKKIEQEVQTPAKIAKPLKDKSAQTSSAPQESTKAQENHEAKEDVIQESIAQSEEAEQEEYEKTNFHSIRDMVLANLKYPNNARRMGLHGTVEIVLVIDTNGKLIDVILHKSSGHSLLDKSALKSADKLCKATLPAPQIVSRVMLPIYFALN